MRAPKCGSSWATTVRAWSTRTSICAGIVCADSGAPRGRPKPSEAASSTAATGRAKRCTVAKNELQRKPACTSREDEKGSASCSGDGGASAAWGLGRLVRPHRPRGPRGSRAPRCGFEPRRRGGGRGERGVQRRKHAHRSSPSLRSFAGARKRRHEQRNATRWSLRHRAGSASDRRAPRASGWKVNRALHAERARARSRSPVSPGWSRRIWRRARTRVDDGRGLIASPGVAR